MRGIVQSRPFVKKSKAHFNTKSSFSFAYGRKKRGQSNSFIAFAVQKWGAIGLVILLSLFLVIFLLKGTWYNPAYLIQTIEYSAETKAKYGNTELFVLASKFLRGKYYNALRVGGENQLLDWVKKEYPFVKSANISFLGNQKIKVDFDFQEPDFLVKIGERKFGVWKDGINNELNPEWRLGKTGFIIDTPEYLSGTTSLSGFFYEVDYRWYQDYLPLIQEALPTMKRFVYLAGSPSFVIFVDNKMVFFYKEHPLDQLQKLNRLKKYYSDYDKLKTIDLGSLTQEKVVVSK